MTQDTRTSETTFRKLHASVLTRRRATTANFFLDDADFRFAAECERMRVDRNGSVLALLLVRLPNKYPEDVALFARVLEGRIRVTDTPGLLKDGRVAILLPDTRAEGAWNVATDLSEVYPPGPGRPECEVLVYPDNNRGRGPGNGDGFESSDDYDSAGDDSTGDYVPAVDVPAVDVDSADGVESRAHSGSQVSDEFFFAKSLPIWKRSLDVLGGTVGLLASLPILAVAAASVKATSPGPAFFRQQREGHGGSHFTMWKLRTMCEDAEAMKHELRIHSQQDGPAFKMTKDPRTTTVGRFLRWSSIDELPQFWNVIRGDMSLVGPRPLPTEESAACEGWQRRRLQVKPGMTCTWQVCERGNVSFDEWVRMDLRYAKKPSLLEDTRLLVTTLPSLLMRKGMR